MEANEELLDMLAFIELSQGAKLLDWILIPRWTLTRNLLISKILHVISTSVNLHVMSFCSIEFGFFVVIDRDLHTKFVCGTPISSVILLTNLRSI